MRTPKLQYLYLQKPLVLLLLITVISVCWIYKGDFYTKRDLRKASVAASMVEKNEWILPHVSANEIAYKPPFAYWLMAVFSLPQGSVSPFTARLPSALAFVCLIGFSFLFFGRRLKGVESFLIPILLITSFGLHRAVMTTLIDMVLTTLIVLGLFSLFRWEEEKKLKGFPVIIPFILSLATLTKGPVGIVLPLLVFGVYLLLLQYNFWKISGKFILIALAAMVLPAIWYYLAYRQGGQAFLDLVWAKNFGRFLGGGFHISNFMTLIVGFIPWIILLFLSLFGLKYSFKIPAFKTICHNLLSMEKVKLFSLVSAIVIVLFYCIPVGKRSVSLMPAYPFIAVFMAQYIIYLTKHKPKITRIFSLIIGYMGVLMALVILLAMVAHLVDPMQLFGFIKSERILSDIATVWSYFGTFNLLYVILLCILLYTIYILFSQLRKKNNLKLLYATVGLYLAIFLTLDGIFFI